VIKINWKIKSLLYKVLFTLKAKKILFYIQKNITRRAKIKIENISDNWKYHLKYLKSFSSKTILEFGAGKSLEQNIFLAYQLDKKISQTAIDNSNMLDIKYFNQANEQMAQILNVEKKPFVKSLEEIKKFYNIKYLAPYSIEKIKKNNNIFDACISTATLEHLPKEELERLFINLKDIVKKNGIISSLIDYSDHYSHTDNKIGPLNFLKFNENEWNKYNNAYLFQNRLRHQDYRKIFLSIGYEIVEEKKGNIGNPPKNISDKFNSKNNETFILWGQFILKNN